LTGSEDAVGQSIAYRYNEAGDSPVQRCLKELGIDTGNQILPVSLGNKLLDMPLANRANNYPSSNPAQGVNAPWAGYIQYY